MANDINMWQDIRKLENKEEAEDLLNCFLLKYIEDGDKAKVEEAKKSFKQKYGYWNNWY